MKKTDLYLKPGTYIKSSTTSGEVQGISLENFVVSVLNNPTCCPKPPGSPDGMLMTALPLNLTLQTVTDFVGNNSAIQLSTLRLGIRSDSSVTTQTSSVIQATTTNANLVIAPNGTGALVADIPDGTATGGNARGNWAVDLQRLRTLSNRVSSGVLSTVLGGQDNKSTADYTVVVGGLENTASTNQYAVVVGGYNNISSGVGSFIGAGTTNTATANYTTVNGANNNATSAYSTVSGGQSNTAGTGTHATVVGGQSNVSSGGASISGGLSNTASGTKSIALGWNNTSSSDVSVALGYQNTANGTYSVAMGAVGTASGQFAVSLGYNNVSAARSSACIGGETNRANATNSVVMSGTQGFGYLYSQIVSNPNSFTAQGDCQNSQLNAFRTASLNSAATGILSLDGTGTTNLIIPSGNNRLWAVKVVATAFVSVAGGTLVLGDSYMGEFTLLFKRVGGTSSVVGVSAGNIIYDTNMATAAFTFAAGASQDLQITFKAPTTASATTFRCVAKVELVEVAY
jgi:hypothetical protein